MEVGKKAAADVLDVQNKVRQVLSKVGTALSFYEIADKILPRQLNSSEKTAAYPL